MNHILIIFSVRNKIYQFNIYIFKYCLAALQQLMNTSDSASKETIGLLLHMINDITPGK